MTPARWNSTVASLLAPAVLQALANPLPLPGTEPPPLLWLSSDCDPVPCDSSSLSGDTDNPLKTEGSSRASSSSSWWRWWKVSSAPHRSRLDGTSGSGSDPKGVEKTSGERVPTGVENLSGVTLRALRGVVHVSVGLAAWGWWW